MRAIRRAAPAALLGAWAAALCTQSATAAAATRPASTPPGHRDTAFRVHVSPRVIAPGGRVMLVASGCRGDTTVSSDLFPPVVLRPHTGADTAVVAADPRPGADHRVRFRCADGPERTVDLAVTGRHHADGPPRHGVRAGLGGSWGDFDRQQVAVGGLLLVGAFGLAWRRARRHLATDPPRTAPSPTSVHRRKGD